LAKAIQLFISGRSPRPGHADLAGALKYNFSEARYVSSVHPPGIGGASSRRRNRQSLSSRAGRRSFKSRRCRRNVAAQKEFPGSRFNLYTIRKKILLNCADAETQQRMKDEVDKVLKTGDSLVASSKRSPTAFHRAWVVRAVGRTARRFAGCRGHVAAGGEGG